MSSLAKKNDVPGGDVQVHDARVDDVPAGDVPVHVVYVLATTPRHHISQLAPQLTENETLVQMEVSPEVCYPIPMPLTPGQVTTQHEKVLELIVKDKAKETTQ